jgi:hypothetical protein
MHNRDSGQGNKISSTWTQGNHIGEPRVKFSKVQLGKTLSGCNHEIWINNLAAAPLAPEDGWLSMRGQYWRGENIQPK